MIEIIGLLLAAVGTIFTALSFFQDRAASRASPGNQTIRSSADRKHAFNYIAFWAGSVLFVIWIIMKDDWRDTPIHLVGIFGFVAMIGSGLGIFSGRKKRRSRQ